MLDHPTKRRGFACLLLAGICFLAAPFVGWAAELTSEQSAMRKAYVRQLQPATHDFAFIYLQAAPPRPSDNLQCGPLRLNTLLQKEQPSWTFVPLVLLQHAGNSTDPAANTERKLALMAIRDVFGFLAQFGPIPQYWVVQNGTVLGYGSCSQERSEGLYVRFAPDIKRRPSDQAPVNWEAFIHCMMTRARSISLIGMSPSLPDARTCIATGTGSSLDLVSRGISPLDSLYPAAEVDQCLQSKETGGLVPSSDAIRCIRERRIGNNYVSFHALLENPFLAIRCSQEDSRLVVKDPDCQPVLLRNGSGR